MSSTARSPAVDKRRIILDAAVRVFARQGFHTCRVSDIADEAGVAYGLVYHYFGSKDEVLDTLFVDRWSKLLAAIEEIDSRAIPARDKLHAIAGFIVDSYRHDPDLMKVIIVEVTRAANSFGQTHLATIRDAYRRIGAIVAKAQEAGEFRDSVSSEFAAMRSTAPSSRSSPAGSSACSRRRSPITRAPRPTSSRRSARGWTPVRPHLLRLPPDDRQRPGQAPDVLRSPGRPGRACVRGHHEGRPPDLDARVRGRSSGVTPDDRQRSDDTAAFAAPRPSDEVTPASVNAEAHNADTREQLAHSDTRRAQEEHEKAEKEVEAAKKREEELERKEAEAREREKRVAEQASSARSSGSGAPAGAAAPAASRKAATPAADDPFADLPFGDRPEIQAGIAFGATFLFAKILKAIGN